MKSLIAAPIMARDHTTDQEVKMKFNSSAAMRAGLIGAVISLAVAVIGRIPLINCFVCGLAPLVALGAGVLYTNFAAGLGQQVDIAEGAVGGGIAGAITYAAHALIGGILALLFGAVQAASNIVGGELGSALTSTASTIGGVLISIITGVIIGAILGAIGGLAFAAIKGRPS